MIKPQCIRRCAKVSTCNLSLLTFRELSPMPHVMAGGTCTYNKTNRPVGEKLFFFVHVYLYNTSINGQHLSDEQGE